MREVAQEAAYSQYLGLDCDCLNWDHFPHSTQELS
jgi:hypothetical protein